MSEAFSGREAKEEIPSPADDNDGAARLRGEDEEKVEEKGCTASEWDTVDPEEEEMTLVVARFFEEEDPSSMCCCCWWCERDRGEMAAEWSLSSFSEKEDCRKGGRGTPDKSVLILLLRPKRRGLYEDSSRLSRRSPSSLLE